MIQSFQKMVSESCTCYDSSGLDTCEGKNCSSKLEAFWVRVGICRSQDSHSNWGEILCLCTRIFPLARDASSVVYVNEKKKTIKLGPLLVLEVASCKDTYWLGKNASRLSSMRTTKSGNPEWYLYLLS